MSAIQKNLVKSQSNVIPRSTVRISKNSPKLEEYPLEESKSRFKDDSGKPSSKNIHDLMKEDEERREQMEQ
jgi:hypothetical protein